MEVGKVKWYQFFLQSVPFTRIRHNDLACYLKEGFGASPIEAWPVYTFFEHYLAHEKAVAERDFETWYKEQLGKYHSTPKAKGGMYKGSLYMLIEEKCQAPFSEVEEGCKNAAIRERVLQRFQLLESIKERGYRPTETERIDAVLKKGYVYLCHGHHRAAALRVLGKDELPGVLVFPNQFVYTVFHLLRTVLYACFQKQS